MMLTALVAPAVVLMQASGEGALGPTGALVVALAFPLAWGLDNWRQQRGFGILAGIGLVSTVLTGGIGLLQLDASWFAIKEAGVSALFGVVVALSACTRKPLIRALLLHPSLFDVARLEAALEQRGSAGAFCASPSAIASSPGAIAPPRNTPPASIKLTVVALPQSTVIAAP